MAKDLKIDRLKSQLLDTGLSQKDNPLYQVINQLIELLRGLEKNVFGTSGAGGSSGSLAGQTYITVNNETATLPNSKQLVAGANITLTVAGNTITISSTAASVTNLFNTEAGVTVGKAEIGLTPGRKNGQTILRGKFTNKQIGAPVLIQQMPNKDSEIGFLQFIGQVIDQRTIRVFWQAPLGAPSKVVVNFLIGA